MDHWSLRARRAFHRRAEALPHLHLPSRVRRLLLATVAFLVVLTAPAGAAAINVFVGMTAIPGGFVTAQLWIDADGGTCTRSSGGAGYSDAAACSSFQTAYNASSAGDTICINAGTGYGSQTLAATDVASAAVRTFKQCNGAVTINALTTAADFVTFDGFTATGRVQNGWNGTGVHQTLGVTFQNTSLQEGVTNSYTLNTTYSGGEVCCLATTTTSPGYKLFDFDGQVPGGGTSSYNDGLTVDNVNVHDNSRNDPGIHTECFFGIALHNAVIRNSHFWNCAIYDMVLAHIGTDLPPANVTIENNIFEAPDDLVAGDESGNSAIELGGSIAGTNIVYRNNDQEGTFEFNGWQANWKITDNIIDRRGSFVSCGDYSSAARFVGNFGDGTCTGMTNVATPSAMFVSAAHATGDYHLKAGAAAISGGSATAGDFSTTDRSGATRNSPPEAGAYEFP